jgi:ribonuclease HI
VFTDGSELANEMTGAGFALYQSKKQFLQSSFSLSPNKEIFDTEAEAALAGVKAAFELYTARSATNLWVCLENLEVATRLLSPFVGSSQEVFESFQAIASTWLTRERFPYTDGGSVRICWVPGHSQVPENEAADQAVKKGAAMNPPPSSSRHSYASLRRRAKTDAISALHRHW